MSTKFEKKWTKKWTARNVDMTRFLKVFFTFVHKN
nr:MAG TPA: hypothetical protein [Caudoviricetes sp.]